MEIHIQECQNCHSIHLKNILYREHGKPDKVYVQCHDCKEFVASYIISPLGYYHHGKGFESFLRGVHRSGGFMSGRRVKRLFTDRKEIELATFHDLISKLEMRENDLLYDENAQEQEE